MVLSEDPYKIKKQTTFIKRPLQLIVLLEADQLEAKQQEPIHGKFGPKHLGAMNAIRRLTCTYTYHYILVGLGM